MPETVNIAEVDRIVAGIGRSPDAVIPILRAIQQRYNYLPEPALRRVCEVSEITPAAMAGVSTFYAQFRHRPAGRHMIDVCIGTACHVKGAETVYHAFRRVLGITGDEDTDAQRLFTVRQVACLGCCMLAPAVRIDDITYGHLDAQKVPGVLKDFLAAQQQRAAGARSVARAAAVVAGEVRLCVCSSCDAAGARAVFVECEREVQEHGLAATVKEVGCTGVSFEAPLLEVALADGRLFRYGRIQPPDVKAVLLRHFRPATLPQRLAAKMALALESVVAAGETDPVIRYALDVAHGADSAFWNCQKRIVTEHGGALAPLDLDEYIRHGGFAALKTCLDSPAPETVIETIETSGLRGRGGAGYPTARKWRSVRGAPGETKYIICNGDEGDPGAFMDRMTLESFPYRVLEGMAIAAVAVGAAEGVLYIRAEYPLALHRVGAALAQCEARGILGERLMGTGPALRLRVVEGAGAFVCGEETALIAAIEGRRGMPRFRPPYPAEAGLWGKPTLINNVETLANVPWIVRQGAVAFASLGTRGSAGSKTFALAGKVVHGGLIEVPMGMTLRQIVEQIGGGIQDGGKLKAVQVGGPSGGCVPASLCDTPVDYEALTAAGAIMGSGGMVVLDETDCMVDVARYFMTFTQRESCGKCTFCRVGTQRMLEILERLCAGHGEAEDVERLEDLSRLVQRGSLCGLGRTAPNPVLSTLQHFRAEYDAHLRKRCPAKRCKALIRYVISDDCIGCTRCAQRCPVKAIPMTPYRKHEIDVKLCIRCDTCRKTCPAKAVQIE